MLNRWIYAIGITVYSNGIIQIISWNLFFGKYNIFLKKGQLGLKVKWNAIEKEHHHTDHRSLFICYRHQNCEYFQISISAPNIDPKCLVYHAHPFHIQTLMLTTITFDIATNVEGSFFSSRLSPDNVAPHVCTHIRGLFGE